MFGKELNDIGFKRAAFVAAAGVCITGVFFMPSLEGAYRLSRWGSASFFIAALSVYTLFLRGLWQRVLPSETGIFGWASAYVGAAIVIPLFGSPSPVPHVSSALLLLSGLLFSYLTATAFSHADGQLRKKALRLLMYTGGTVALLIALQQAGLSLFVSKAFSNAEFRGHGTFGNPNWAAAFLLPLVPVAFGLFQEEDRVTGRAGFAVAALVITAGLVATLSKGAIVSLPISLLVYMLLGRSMGRYSKALLLCGSLGIIILALYYAAIQGYYQSLPWMQGRVFLWQTALLLFAEHPLAGIGLGGFLPSYPSAMVSLIQGDANSFMPLGTIRFLHNDFLQTAVEGGAVTALLFSGFVAFALLRAHRRGDAYSRGIAAGLAGIVVYGFVDSPLHVPASWMLFWLLVGLLMAGPAGSKGIPGGPLSGKTQRVIMVFLALAATISMVQGIRHVAGAAFWTVGKRDMKIRTIDRSIRNLRIAGTLLPDVGDVRFDYANALAMKERYDDALRESQAASRVYFDFENAFFEAKMYEYLDGPRTAEKNWNTLIKKYPLLVRPHYELGRLALSMNDHDRARREFLTAITSLQESSGADEYRSQAAALLAAIQDIPWKKHAEMK